jgi:hypothetical protein
MGWGWVDLLRWGFAREEGFATGGREDLVRWGLA